VPGRGYEKECIMVNEVIIKTTTTTPDFMPVKKKKTMTAPVFLNKQNSK
jgi:hypothetical protein